MEIIIQGLFQLFLEKIPGLNWEKICAILGYFGNIFKSVQTKINHLNMCMIMMILFMYI